MNQEVKVVFISAFVFTFFFFGLYVCISYFSLDLNLCVVALFSFCF